ncbi:MAG: Gfo/Idh/MocA family oxidoreductase [Candidatus Aminicenantes bacterium]
MKRINWGIIGCGDVTEIKSGPAFNKIKDSHLLAVMRRTPGKAADYAKRHSVPKWYDDANQLIHDPDINAVYIATPPDTHAKYTIMAAEAGKHIYVEKPMALNFSECQRMIEAAEKARVCLFVAYYRRCLPSFVKIKEWIESGTIGDPRTICIKLVKPAFQKGSDLSELPWRVRPEISGGGLFVDLGSHQLDYLDYLFGPIISVKGFTVNQTGIYPAEDMVSACFMFESGVIGTGTWCFTASKQTNTDQIEIIGSKGKITFSTFEFTPVQLETESGIETHDYPKPKHVQQALIQTVVDELLGRGKCPSTGITASRTSKTIEKILENYYSPATFNKKFFADVSRTGAVFTKRAPGNNKNGDNNESKSGKC